MRWILAVRQLMVRPGRAALLLGGYAIGVSVMVVLLSISEAMLEQSRDPVLIGGGDVLVVPEGIDLEAIRTGGIGGLFQGIDRARFVIRQQLGGPRLADVVASISPTIDQRSLTMQFNGRTFAVRAGAGIPSRAVAMGVGLDVVDGAWHDSRADSLWLAPTDDQLYDELDRWHLPVRRDSTWAEWHYFNIQPSADEWWYVTLMVVGDVPDGQWGGQLLVTRRTPDGEYHRWADTVSTDAIRFDTTGADLTVGRGSVRQQDGRYQLSVELNEASINLTIIADRNRWFPPLELLGGDFRSGYVVPILRGTASGTLCQRGDCLNVDAIPAYHDHNWGIWRDVTWEWGAANGTWASLLYGGVLVAGETATEGTAPFFMALVDSLGVSQVYRFADVVVSGPPEAPDSLAIVAHRGRDSLDLRVTVLSSTATRDSVGRQFIQMLGRWRLRGTAGGALVADSGRGFFETWSGN